MRSTRTILAAMIATASLVGVGLTTDAATAASTKDLKVAHSSVMKNETFIAFGQLSTHVSRPIKLQYKRGHSWVTTQSQSTESAGTFEFGVAISTSRTFRYYAPKSGSHASITGHAKKISVVGQSASAFIYPAEICVSDPAQTIRVAATFKLARAGRDVSIVKSGISSFAGGTDSGGHFISGDLAPNFALGTHTVTLRADSFRGSAAKTVSATYKVVNTCLI